VPLQVFQSLWGMIGLPRETPRPWSPSEQLDQIVDAGFDGVSIAFHDPRHPEEAAQSVRQAAERGLRVEAGCFSADQADVDALLEVLSTLPAITQIKMQPALRTPHVDVAAKAIEQWYAAADQAGIPLLIETHRGRLTSDILFTAELLDAVPRMRLVADLSHYVNGDEFAVPVDERNQALIEKVLGRTDGFDGRVAAPGQIQVTVRALHTAPLLDLFTGWWQRGFELRHAENPEATVVFTTELGPPDDWYAPLDTDGRELTDRWAEALDLADVARSLWTRATHDEQGQPR
jgi:Xylose isomerase-like TIM barrel